VQEKSFRTTNSAPRAASLAARLKHKLPKGLPQRFVEMAGERLAQVMLGDQFHDVGKVLMGPPQIPFAARDFRFD
jgi:response regulator RpfG family c-di-GMP phosphodiesterase